MEIVDEIMTLRFSPYPLESFYRQLLIKLQRKLIVKVPGRDIEPFVTEFRISSTSRAPVWQKEYEETDNNPEEINWNTINKALFQFEDKKRQTIELQITHQYKDKRPPARAPSSARTQPTSRDENQTRARTRACPTSRMLEQLEDRQRDQEESDYVKLTRRWRCASSACKNHNQWCWIDPQQRHHKLYVGQIQTWVEAVKKKVCTTQNPPSALVLSLVGNREEQSSTKRAGRSQAGQHVQIFTGAVSQGSNPQPPAAIGAILSSPVQVPASLRRTQAVREYKQWHLSQVDEPSWEQKLENAFEIINNACLDLPTIRRKPISWFTTHNILEGFAEIVKGDVKSFITTLNTTRPSLLSPFEDEEDNVSQRSLSLLQPVQEEEEQEDTFL